MAKKKPDTFDYSKAKKSLGKFGWDLPSKTSSQKAKLKAFWKTKAAYINHLDKDRLVDVIIGVKKGVKKKKGRTKIAETSKLEYRFKHQKLTPKQQEAAKNSRLFSKEQFTPTGIFIERPVNIPAKDYKVSFHGDSVEITADCRHDEIVNIDPDLLATDPDKAIAEAIANRRCRERNGKGPLKTPKTYSLMVNGFRSKHSSTSEKVFLQYIKNQLLPDWLDKNDDDETLFSDIFHIRLIY